MGDVMPPIQLARAIPNKRQGATGEPSGKVRKMGLMREKQRTGVATLEIHRPLHNRAYHKLGPLEYVLVINGTNDSR